MKRKFFVCLIGMAIISSMMSSVYAQSTLNVRVFIEGYYDSLQNEMVPVLDAVNTPTLFDTVTINLHSTINLSIVFTQKVILDINGNGTVILPPSLFNNSYYLDIRHRNSLQTWSSLPILITSVVNYDFTTAVSQAYGNNLSWIGNAACIFSGNFNQDEWIDLSDFPFWDDQSVNSPYGYYLLCDLTGDSIVDTLDLFFWAKNNNAFTFAHYPFVGIDDFDFANSIEIYPNPADQQIKIVVNDLNIEEANIYSLSGKEIERINVGSGSFSLDISKYSSGIYLIKFGSGNEVYTQKFVVEH